MPISRMATSFLLLYVQTLPGDGSLDQHARRIITYNLFKDYPLFFFHNPHYKVTYYT